MAYHLRVDVVPLGDVYDALGGRFVGVYLHSMAHVEDGVHLFPVGAAFVVDQSEQRWGGEEVVFHHMQLVDKVQHLGLGSATAVYHAADFRTVFVKHATDHRSICACGRQNQMAGINALHFGGVGQLFAATVDDFIGQVMVVALGVFLSIVAAENVVSCRCQAVAAHAAVVAVFVCGLAIGG